MAGPVAMEIDGRNATVTGWDTERGPVELDDASVAKVVFDDGEVVFGVLETLVTEEAEDA